MFSRLPRLFLFLPSLVVSLAYKAVNKQLQHRALCFDTDSTLHRHRDFREKREKTASEEDPMCAFRAISETEASLARNGILSSNVDQCLL